MTLYNLKQFLKFAAMAKNHHGVHSPFVFKLVTDCFYDKTIVEDYKMLDAYRKPLYKARSNIKVTDLGAGSHALKNNLRNLRDIAKHAGISRKRAKLLFRLVKYLKAESILELGTSLGLATSAMALANPKGRIITVEGCPETASVAKEQFKKFKFQNIQLINDHFDQALPTLLPQKFDLIYLDGNHQKEPTLRYFEMLMSSVHNDSLMIIDDIYWSKEMTEAWHTLCQHPKVTVSIDTFSWGLVFFRKEQAKEHFTITV